MRKWDYDDDARLDADDPEVDEDTASVWFWGMCVILGLLLLAQVVVKVASAQDFSNLAGAKQVTVSGAATFPVDPLAVLSAQPTAYLCGHIAILSAARADPKSPLYAVGEKPLKCAENVDPIQNPGGTPPAGAISFSGGVLSGRVADAAVVAVRLSIDGSEVSGATVPVTAGAWSWPLPAALRDGQRHVASGRMLNAAGGVVGQLTPINFTVKP